MSGLWGPRVTIDQSVNQFTLKLWRMVDEKVLMSRFRLIHQLISSHLDHGGGGLLMRRSDEWVARTLSSV